MNTGDYKAITRPLFTGNVLEQGSPMETFDVVSLHQGGFRPRSGEHIAYTSPLEILSFIHWGACSDTDGRYA